MEVRVEFRPYDHWSGSNRLNRMSQLVSDLATLGFKSSLSPGCLNLVAFMIIYNPGAKTYADASTSPIFFGIFSVDLKNFFIDMMIDQQNLDALIEDGLIDEDETEV